MGDFTAGLPTIIKPFFGDQYFYADRVATLGIGSAVRDLTVEHLAAAITRAVTDEKQIARANLAGETIRKEDGVGNAIECIYRDLEYSKSLLPPLLESKLESTNAVTIDSTHAIISSPVASISPRYPRRSTSISVSSARRSPSNNRQGGESRDELSGDESSSWDILSARGSERSNWAEDDSSRRSSVNLG